MYSTHVYIITIKYNIYNIVGAERRWGWGNRPATAVISIGIMTLPGE